MKQLKKEIDVNTFYSIFDTVFRHFVKPIIFMIDDSKKHKNSFNLLSTINGRNQSEIFRSFPQNEFYSKTFSMLKIVNFNLMQK